jgi:hypothetical protein
MTTATVREGQFRHTSAKIEFPHQIFRGPRHLKPIIRCHVALFDKIYLTPKIPRDQKLVNCYLGTLCEEKYFFFNFFF